LDNVRELLQRFGRNIDDVETITAVTLHYERGMGWGIVFNGQTLQLKTGLPICVESLLHSCMLHQGIKIDARHNMTTQAKRSVGE